MEHTYSHEALRDFLPPLLSISSYKVLPESVNVAIIMSDFRLLLLEISNEITNADLAKLKFLCEDVIPSRTGEGISQPFELFRALEQRNLLSEQNREFLASKLSDINRVALRNKLLGIQGKSVLKELYMFVLFFII